MRRVLILTTVLAWFLAAGIENANACSCGGGGSPCESYGGAAAVFVGTVVGYRENRPPSKEVARKEVDWLPRVFKFAVEQAYLGVGGAEIEVSTGTGSSDCGFEFKSGQRYLVYAYRHTERLTTSICTRTRPFTDASEDLAFLGNLSSAAPGATINGRIQLGRNVIDDLDISVTIEGENERKEIRPDSQGRYRLSGLRPGKFKVKLHLPDTFTVFQPEREVTVADRGCAGIDFYVIENGKVSGRVFDVVGQPVPNILVALIKPETTDPTTWEKLERTDEEGRYSFSAVPRGRYIIAINFNRFPDPKDPTNAYPRAFYPGVLEQVQAQIINVELGAKVPEHDVRLPPKRSSSAVEGHVVWSDGTLVANPFVTVKDVTYNDSVLGHLIQPDESGRFRLEGYIGQKLIIQAWSTHGGVGSYPKQAQITLDQPVQVVKIVLNKRN